MSSVPRRKPLSPTKGQGTEDEVSIDTGLLAPISALSTTISSQQGSSQVIAPDNTAKNPQEDTLTLSKAKLEQLAYFLLDLVGSANKGQPILSQDYNEESQAGSSFRPTTPLSSLELHGAPAVTVQEMLDPSGHNPMQTSQTYLQNKPWSQSRIAVEFTDTDTISVNPEASEEIVDELNSGIESFPLTQTHSTIYSRVYTLQENSLYTLQMNHAWTDFHTQLGPGKFTEEGAEYWLWRRGSNTWPEVVPPQKRLNYLTELWTELTTNSPAADINYTIISDLRKQTHPSKVDSKSFARRVLQQSFVGRTAAHETPKVGPLSTFINSLESSLRYLFHNADSARCRLPSTMFLRIIGQNLFAKCLPMDRDNYGEQLLRILITSLRTLSTETESEQANVEAFDTPGLTGDRNPTNSHRGSTATVWDLLASCYRTKVLQQPLVGDERALFEHISRLFTALELINIFSPRIDEVSLLSMPIDVLLSTQMASICPKIILRRQESGYTTGSQDYFGKKDLSIRTLQDIGQLQILWTRHLDEHLSFNPDTGEIRIFWPAWTLANLPCTSLFSPYPVSEALKDLLSTYSFLFYAKNGFYDAVRDYNAVASPSWLASMDYYIPLSDLTNHRPFIGDTRYHFASYFSSHVQGSSTSNMKKSLIRFDACGIFETRVRLLKGYMDSQRPSGLAALWRDKRDSGQWYTFWLVAWVGGLSIILSLASLAVSIAQTWATFESLHLQMPQNKTTNSTTSRTSTNSTMKPTTSNLATHATASQPLLFLCCLLLLILQTLLLY